MEAALFVAAALLVVVAVLTVLILVKLGRPVTIPEALSGRLAAHAGVAGQALLSSPGPALVGRAG